MLFRTWCRSFVCLDALNMGLDAARDKRDFLLLQLSCIKLKYVR